MSNAEFKVQRMTGTIGASITGIDLNKLDDETFARLHEAFLDHCVIVVRNQNLEPDQHIAFGSRFGPLVMTLGAEILDKPAPVGALEGYPQILEIRNLGKKETITETWHADNDHVPCPTSISLLAAKDLPPAGGDTMFCNQYLAYETLSDRMKFLLRGLRLKHTGANQLAYRGKVNVDIPYAMHPVVCTHPDTDRRVLYLGGPPDLARPHFEGMSVRESEPLHRFLFDHSIQPHSVYRHHWCKGDVLIWDNRCTMHYAVHDYGDAPRNMNRVTVQGQVPFESPYFD